MFSKMLVAPFDAVRTEMVVPHFTSNSGALGFLKILQKEDHDLLARLERFIVKDIPHYCGLNPRDYQ